MYHFAVVALLALATLKVAELVEDLVPGLGRFHGLLLFALAIVGAVALDYSVFAGFRVHVRETWMGAWFTGGVIASLATVWHAVLRYLGDEEEVAGAERRARSRPRIAA